MRIESGHYSFSFNKDDRLGMICPTWKEPQQFPCGSCNEGTYMHLELQPDFEVDDLAKDLELFGTKTLILLRKLAKIQLRIYSPSGGLSTEHTLSRNGDPADRTCYTTTILYNKFCQKFFVTSSYPVDGLSDGDRKILLAFRIDDDMSEPETQYVYNFLPIRDYGLKVHM